MHPALPVLSLSLIIASGIPAFMPADRAVVTTTPAPAAPPLVASEIDLARHFGDFEGCMVLFDPGANTLRRYNAPRASERFSPCSTFKVPNSLIGLETGVIKDADFELKWDGVKRSREALNHDHTLRTAMRDSVVWYYQELARRVGRDRMEKHLRALNYGNMSTAGPIDEFWLNGTLTISADEQVAFIDRLRRADVPFSKRSVDIVQDVMKLDERDGWTLYGKTGTEGRDNKAILGWFVGWVTSKDRTLVFAANMSGDDATGPKTKAIVLKILSEQGAPLAP